MITRLNPEQIAQNWDFLAYGIEKALPPVAGALDRMTRILESALSGVMDVWVIWRRDDEQLVLEGVVLTAVEEDFCSGSKSLLIYALYGYVLMSKESLTQGYAALREWARSKGCGQIAAYTNQTRVLDMVKKQGGSTEWSYVTLAVGGE